MKTWDWMNKREAEEAKDDFWFGWNFTHFIWMVWILVSFARQHLSFIPHPFFCSFFLSFPSFSFLIFLHSNCNFITEIVLRNEWLNTYGSLTGGREEWHVRWREEERRIRELETCDTWMHLKHFSFLSSRLEKFPRFKLSRFCLTGGNEKRAEKKKEWEKKKEGGKRREKENERTLRTSHSEINQVNREEEVLGKIFSFVFRKVLWHSHETRGWIT